MGSDATWKVVASPASFTARLLDPTQDASTLTPVGRRAHGTGDHPEYHGGESLNPLADHRARQHNSRGITRP